MMTVKKLICLLEQEEPDSIVVLSKDGEGNSFSPLSSLGDYLYSSGEITDESDLREQCEEYGSDFEASKATYVNAIVLWPR